MSTSQTHPEPMNQIEPLKKRIAELEAKLQGFEAQKPSQLQPHDRLAFLLDNAPLGVIEWDREKHVIAFSKGAEDIFGWKAGEVIGKHWSEWEHVYEEDTQAVQDLLHQTGEEKSPHLYSLNRNYRKDGAVIWCEWYDSVLYDASGAPISILSFVKDVTEQVKAEQAMRESEERFRSYVDSSPANIYLKDENLRYTFANQSLLRSYGMTLEDYLQTHFSDHFDVETAKRVEDADRRILNGEAERIDQEYQGIRKGKPVWLRDIKFPLHFSDGRIRVGGIALDISEAKEAQLKLEQNEARLREAESWYRTTLYSIGDAVITTDHAGCVRQMNQIAEKLTGWRESEASGRPLEEVFVIANEQTGKKVESPVKRVLKEGKIVGLANHTVLISRDGQEIPIVDSAAPIHAEDGSIVGAVLVFRDQSAERAAHNAIRESEERYRSLFNSMLNGFILYKVIRDEQGQPVDFRYVQMNPAFEQLTGLKAAEVVGKTLKEVFPHLETHWMDQFSQTVLEGKPHQAENYSVDVDKYYEVYSYAPEPDHLALIFIDTTERVRTRLALKESEEKYRALYENAPLAYQSLDVAGNIRDVNPQWLKTLGYERDEVIGRLFSEFLLPDWGSHFERNFPAFKARGYVHDVQFRMQHKDGHYIDVSFEGCIGYNPDGSIKQTYCVFQDITLRKQAEEALRESERQFRTLFETMAHGVVIHDEDGKILEANKAAERILGMKHDQLLGLTSLDPRWRAIREDGSPFPGEEHPAMIALQTGEAVHDVVMGVYSPLIEKRNWININAVPVFLGSQERPAQVYVTFEDITERKEALDALKESEERYRTIFEGSNNPHAVIDTQGNYLEANEAFCRFVECSREELLQKNALDFAVPGSDQAIKTKHEPLWQSGGSLETEYFINGKIKTLQLTITPGAWHGRQVVFGIGADITERKQAEDALRKSEEKFRLIAESSAEDIWQLDLDGNVTYASPAVERMFGYTPLEAEELGFAAFFPEDQLDRAGQAFAKALAGEPYQLIEFSGRKKDGTKIPVEVSVMPIIQQGRITGVQGIARDITERVQTEQALRESEEKYRLLFNSPADGIVLHDREGKIRDVNPVFCERLGYSREEFLGMRLYDVVVPEVAARVRERLGEIEQQGGLVFESAHISRSGRTIPVETNVKQVEMGGEKLLLSITRDITERVQAEKALRESEFKMKSIFRAAPVGIGIVSSRVFQEVNDHFCEMTGYSREELVGQNARMVYPSDEDYEYVGSEKYRQIARYGTGSVETRFKRKDGAIRQILISSTPLDPDNLRAGVTFTAMDITERVQSEQALRQSETLLRNIIDSSPDLIFVKDKNLRTLVCNDAFARAVGKKPQDLVGKTDIENGWDVEIVKGNPEKGIRGVEKDDLAVLAGESLFVSEEPGNVGNETHYFETHKIPLRSADGEISGVLGISRDITERKHMVEALRLSEDKFYKVFQANPGAVLITKIETGEILDVNHTFEQIFGYPRGEVIGKTTFEINLWKDLKVRSRYMPEFLKAGFFHLDAIEFNKKNGETVIANSSFTRIQISGEDCAISIFNDVTEQVAAQEALRTSEEKFSKSFQHAPLLMSISAVEDGRYLEINDEFLKVSGFSREEVLGKTSVELGWIRGTDRQRMKEKLLEEGRLIGMELDLWTKDNRPVTCLYHGELLEIEGKQRLLSIAIDITGRKAAEKEIEFQSMLVNAVGDAVIATDAEGKITFWNQAAEKVYGWQRDEILGKPIIEVTPSEDMQTRAAEIMERLKAGESWEGEFWVQHRNGERFPILITDSPFTDEQGNLIGIIGVSRDISDLKAKELALQESEARYRSLFDSMLNGFALHEIIYDDAGAPIDYRFLEVNPGFEQMTGLKATDLLGRTVLEVMPNTEMYWIDKYSRVALSGEPLHFESYAQELDRHYEVVAYSPKKGQFATLFTDVSERMRTRQALEESEARYRALVDVAPVSIIVFQEGMYVFANRTAARLHGLQDPRELIGKPALHNISAQYHPVMAGRFKRLDADQPNEPVEIVMEGVDGAHRLVESTSIPIQYQGKPAALVIGQDITERRQIEDSLVAAEKLASIGTLAAGVAHEINTPLQVITGLSQRVIRKLENGDEDTARMTRDMKNLEENAWRVARIVRSLLSYSRVSMDQVETNNLNEIVRDTLVLTEHQLSSWANVHVRTDLQPDLPDFRCERNSLIQVLINLLTNARDAMPSGGEIRIATQYHPARRQYVLNVQDSGVGIPEEEMEQIFEPFYTTKRSGEGTGLGLSVVKSIVETHGGSIKVQSGQGVGATFTISLPEAPPVLETARNPEHEDGVNGTNRFGGD